jgi:hypothetical protein
LSIILFVLCLKKYKNIINFFSFSAWKKEQFNNISENNHTTIF